MACIEIGIGILVIPIPAQKSSGGNKLGLATTVSDGGYDVMNIAICMVLEETLQASWNQCNNNIFDFWHVARGRQSGSGLGRGDY